MDGKNSVVVDNGHLIWGDRLSAWEFKPASSSTKSTCGATPDETPSIAVYNGPPRILEIGCGDGIWCFQVKQMYPDRIIEGIDDTDHWSCVHQELNLRSVLTT
jgi:tRNA G46 methylase TrmB